MNPDPQQPSILVIDDQPANLKVLLSFLQSEGFKVYVADSGERALRQLGNQLADIILLDVMMPEMDGFEVCRRLKTRKLTAPIPVIFMTALTDLEDKIEGFSAGAVDFISKPFQQQEVVARINTHLTIIRQQRELEKQNQALKQAMAEIKQLTGIIPICCRCKKIRDDEGYWKQVEQYIAEHSEAQFSHGFCPGCYEKEIIAIEEQS